MRATAIGIGACSLPTAVQWTANGLAWNWQGDDGTKERKIWVEMVDAVHWEPGSFAPLEESVRRLATGEE